MPRAISVSAEPFRGQFVRLGSNGLQLPHKYAETKRSVWGVVGRPDKQAAFALALGQTGHLLSLAACGLKHRLAEVLVQIAEKTTT